MNRTISFLLFFPIGLLGRSLPGSGPVTLTGGFEASIHIPAVDQKRQVGGLSFGQWSIGAAGGSATTGAFTAPVNMEFDLVGYPKSTGVTMFLQDTADPARQLALKVARNSGPVWVTRRWHIPDEWHGRRVRLVVEDKNAAGAECWIGFTLPREYNVWNVSSFAYAAQAMQKLAWQWILMVLPGFAIAVWFAKERENSPQQTLPVMFAASGVAALLAFFLFVASVKLGKIYSVVLPVFSIALIAVYRARIRPFLCRPMIGVLSLWLLASAFYLSGGLLYRNEDAVNEYVQDRFFSYQLPPDNVLPLLLTDAIYNHHQFRPTFFNDIQSSDRPPLQSGFALLQMIFWEKPDDQYLYLGVLLQTVWIPALWVLLRCMGVNGPPLLAAIAITALSQFAFVHELFVWPKLLSAAFGLLALSRFGWITDRKATPADGFLAGILTALSLLSHGGAMMAVIGFCALICLWQRPEWRWLTYVAAGVALVYLPWVLYQNLYDPPGDALTKLHLAGVIDRNHALTWLLKTNYSKLGFSGWIATKWSDLRALFWSDGVIRMDQSSGERANGFSELKFFCLFPALGLANVGFLLRLRCKPEQRRIADRLLAVAGASLLAWVMMMFSPQATTIHQGSFLMVILLFSGLALLVEAYSRIAVAALIGIQWLEFGTIAVFGELWIRNNEFHISDLTPDVGMFTVFLLLSLVLTAWVWREWKAGKFLAA